MGETRSWSYAHNGWKTAEMRQLLLVEDHALFRQGLALFLEWRTGLDCIQAGSLAEAQRTLIDMKDKPACVIVDLELPDGNGVELIKQLRDLPMLALVSSRSSERRIQALEVGVDEVLPIAESAERIVEAVTRLVDE
jgi:DNA-binding NarL/FixJ family response regulator